MVENEAELSSDAVAVLVAEYEQLIYRDGILIQTLFTVVGIGATLMGGLIFAVPDYKKPGSSIAQNPWVYLAVPLPSTILIGLVVFLGLHASVLAQYAHALELRLQSITKVMFTASELELHGRIVPVPSFMKLQSRLFGAGKTQVTRRYTIALSLLLAVILTLLFAAPIVAIRTAPLRVHLAALLIYVPVNSAFGYAYFRTLQGRRHLLNDAIEDVFPSLRNPEKIPEGRLFLSYLLVPRTVDHAAKVLIGLVGIALGRVLSEGYQGLGPRRGVFWSVLAFVAIFEYLFFQARYTWNDLRDFASDSSHPGARLRRRIPAPLTRAKFVLLWISIPAKVLLGLWLISRYFKAQAPLLTIGTIAIFLAAICYEMARDVTRRKNEIFLGIRRWNKFCPIYALIGSSYAIRIVVGLMLGSGETIRWTVLFLAGSTLWFVEVSSITMTWVFEGSSFLPGVVDKTGRIEEFSDALWRKAHIGYLLFEAGLLSASSVPVLMHRTEVPEDRVLDHRYSGRKTTVWSVAGFASIVLGAFTAATVANGLRIPKWQLILASLLLGALVGSQCFVVQGRTRAPTCVSSRISKAGSQNTLERNGILVLGGGLATLLGILGSFPHWYFLPVLLTSLAGFYEMTRRSSYKFCLHWFTGVLDGPARILKAAMGGSSRALLSLTFFVFGENSLRVLLSQSAFDSLASIRSGRTSLTDESPGTSPGKGG